MKQDCPFLNWDLIYFLYKSYANILTKIDTFIKYLSKYF